MAPSTKSLPKHPKGVSTKDWNELRAALTPYAQRTYAEHVADPNKGDVAHLCSAFSLAHRGSGREDDSLYRAAAGLYQALVAAFDAAFAAGWVPVPKGRANTRKRAPARRNAVRLPGAPKGVSAKDWAELTAALWPLVAMQYNATQQWAASKGKAPGGFSTMQEQIATWEAFSLTHGGDPSRGASDPLMCAAGKLSDAIYDEMCLAGSPARPNKRKPAKRTAKPRASRRNPSLEDYAAYRAMAVRVVDGLKVEMGRAPSGRRLDDLRRAYVLALKASDPQIVLWGAPYKELKRLEQRYLLNPVKRAAAKRASRKNSPATDRLVTTPTPAGFRDAALSCLESIHDAKAPSTQKKLISKLNQILHGARAKLTKRDHDAIVIAVRTAAQSKPPLAVRANARRKPSRRNAVAYRCTGCGHEAKTYATRCQACGKHGSLEDTRIPDTAACAVCGPNQPLRAGEIRGGHLLGRCGTCGGSIVKPLARANARANAPAKPRANDHLTNATDQRDYVDAVLRALDDLATRQRLYQEAAKAERTRRAYVVLREDSTYAAAEAMDKRFKLSADGRLPRRLARAA